MQCRGWVAGKLIDLETVSTEPLIVIPLGLRLQAADAVVMLQQVMVDVGCIYTKNHIPHVHCKSRNMSWPLCNTAAQFVIAGRAQCQVLP